MKKRFISLTAALFIICALLTGCQSGNPSDADPLETPKNTAGPQTENNPWETPIPEGTQPNFNNWQYAHQQDFYRQQIKNGQTAITDATKIFFNDYFRKNNMELRCLPEFALGQSPAWDGLTYFFVFNVPHKWGDGPASEEQFALTIKKYFGDLDYSHKSSAYLEYSNGFYTAVGMSNHGFFIYELTGLEKKVMGDGRDSWLAELRGYYFHESDGISDFSFLSDNAQAVYREMEKEEYSGLDFWQACDRLVWNNPGEILALAGAWTIEFTVNDPAGKVYFTYLSCDFDSFTEYDERH